MWSKMIFIGVFFFSQTGFCGGDRIFYNGFETGVQANLISLTRVNGTSPETVYFSAEGSTCPDCNDVWQLNTPIADAYSELAYHFNFDDSDSGSFATTGNSRNQQVSGSPRAAHTFHCFGVDDPNWDVVDERCEFNVGVRVESRDNSSQNAFIQINIQPLFGVGGYYADEDIFCVSSTSDYSWCPHADGSRQQTDVPSIGNWDNTLVIIDNDGGGYSRICMGADEQNGTAIAYGPNLISGAVYGARPVVNRITLASRPGNCNASFSNDANISMLADNHPERDSQGNLIDGYAFNQKVVGLRVTNVQNGNSLNFVHFHDMDMDWSTDSTATGEFTMVNNPFACRNNNELSCSNMPYPSFMFLTDSVIASNINNLSSPTNIGCFNGCGAVNFVVSGVEVNRAVEHNIRLQGAWGLVLSNNWFRGNHSGMNGGKSRVTIRSIDSSAAHSLTKNPEILTGADYLRGASGVTDFYNRYNVAVDNWINQETHDAAHLSAGWLFMNGNFHIETGTNYIDDGGVSGAQSSLQQGVYRIIRDITFAPNAVSPCGLGTGFYDDGTLYNDSSTIYFEGTPGCTTAQSFNFNLTPLPVPSAP